jgi:hypothetical protein
LPLRFLRYAASSLFRHQTDARQTAEHGSGGEFRVSGQKFFFVSPDSVSPRYVERDRHLQPSSDGKRTEQARTLAFSQQPQF